MSYESLDNFETKLYIEELLEQDVKEIFGIAQHVMVPDRLLI